MVGDNRVELLSELYKNSVLTVERIPHEAILDYESFLISICIRDLSDLFPPAKSFLSLAIRCMAFPRPDFHLEAQVKCSLSLS